MKARNTIQKNMVMEAVRSLDHPTAEEVYSQVVSTHPAISKGTVYRNLNVLAEAGKLQKVGMPGGADRFDDTLDRHYHIRCNGCGKIGDVELPYQADLISRIEDTRGYLIKGHDILLRGICPACRAQESICVKGDNPAILMKEE